MKTPKPIPASLLFGIVVAMAMGGISPGSTVVVDGNKYLVSEDGTVSSFAGNQPVDRQIASKALYTAMVARERITKSQYNKVAFAGPTRVLIESISLVKPVSGIYAYILYSSTDLAVAAAGGAAEGGPGGALGEVIMDVGKDAILLATKELTGHPESLAMRMANDAYAISLRAYRDNYAVYRSVIDTGHLLTYNEAVKFMANERQKEMLGPATQLIRDIRSQKYGQSDEVVRKSMTKATTTMAEMEKKGLGEKVGWAIFATKFKPIFDEAAAGLSSNYPPLKNFKEAAGKLNNGFSDMEAAFRQGKTYTDYKSDQAAKDRWHEKAIAASSAEATASVPTAVQSPKEPKYKQKGAFPDGVVQSRYAPTTVASAKVMISRYGSVPGGVTLEGEGKGMGSIKKAGYDAQRGAIILNGSCVYELPVTAAEMASILLAIAKDDKIGVSMVSGFVTYGALAGDGDISLMLRQTDWFLAHLSYGWKRQYADYRFAKDETLKERDDAFGNVMCYFRFCDYEFSVTTAACLLSKACFVTTLVPIKVGERAKDGGGVPDFEVIEKGIQPANLLFNIKHISDNAPYYMRERMMRMVTCYGEAAAFARGLKRCGIDLKALARTMPAPIEPTRNTR